MLTARRICRRGPGRDTCVSTPETYRNHFKSFQQRRRKNWIIIRSGVANTRPPSQGLKSAKFFCAETSNDVLDQHTKRTGASASWRRPEIVQAPGIKRVERGQNSPLRNWPSQPLVVLNKFWRQSRCAPRLSYRKGAECPFSSISMTVSSADAFSRRNCADQGTIMYRQGGKIIGLRLCLGRSPDGLPPSSAHICITAKAVIAPIPDWSTRKPLSAATLSTWLSAPRLWNINQKRKQGRRYGGAVRIRNSAKSTRLIVPAASPADRVKAAFALELGPVKFARWARAIDSGRPVKRGQRQRMHSTPTVNGPSRIREPFAGA